MRNEVKLLFLDVDGTLTDGKIYMGPQGEMFKAFNVRDGSGLRDILPQHGIIPVIITARESEIVGRRCKELEITEVYQNCRNKKQKMLEVAEKYGLRITADGVIQQTAYMGDDILDIQCMKIAEYKACPADAAEAVKKIVDYICRRKGGDGAVREFIDWLVQRE